VSTPYNNNNSFGFILYITSVAFDAKLQHVECIDTIQSSVRAFHDFMEKSMDHHKTILRRSDVLYEKLSQEVADTRGDISDLVVGICQDISTFQESTLCQLTALQDSLHQLEWPASDHLHRHPPHNNATLLSELGSRTNLSWGSAGTAAHARQDALTEFECNSERDHNRSPTGTVVGDISRPLSWSARLAKVALRMWTGAIAVAWPTR
jgi:hypothetical protein